MAGNNHPEHSNHGKSAFDLHPDNPGVVRDDVDIKAVTRFGIGVALLCLATGGIVWGTFTFLNNQIKSQQPPPSPIATIDPNRLPPEPRLQSRPVLDLKEYRAGEEKLLNTYTPADGASGVMKIPVAAAMKLVARKGLPARSEQFKPVASQIMPTGSSLGVQPAAPEESLVAEPHGSAKH